MRITSLLLLPVLLVACGSPGASTVVDVNGSWQLTSGRTAAGDVPIVDDHPITLTIEGSEAGGTAACNSYGGRITVRGGRVSFEDLAMTAMGCEEPVAASEAAYVAALAGVTAIQRDGEELVLSGQAVELRFTNLPPPPTAELVDTTWVLETIIDGEVASSPMGQPAMLEVRSDGMVSGSTGCRTFNGAWVERGDEILVTSMGMSELECPADLSGQDSHVVSVIGDGFVPSIEDDLLTLTDPGGIGLVYRAQD